MTTPTGIPVPSRRRWRHSPPRRLAAAVATVAFVLHAVAALSLWTGWGRGLRGGFLVWIDFPVSLAYLGVVGPELLAWSLLAGGLWWALVGALAVYIVGWVARRPRARPG